MTARKSMAPVASLLVQPPGTTLPQPLEVRVTDEEGRGVPDFSVSFSTTAGSVSPPGVDTDADGRARTTLTLPDVAATVSVTASGAGVPSVEFTAESVPGQLGFVTLTLAAARVSLPYPGVIATTGGAGGRTLEVVDGALPAGLELGSDGSFTGAPTEAGAFSFEVRVTDGEGSSATREFTLRSCEVPAELAVGAVRVLEASQATFGECGVWLPNDVGNRYYRVAVLRPNRSGSSGGAREVSVTVTGNGVTSSAPTPAPRWRAPGLRGAASPLRLDGLEALAAKREATARLHGRLHREGAAMVRRLGPEAMGSSIARAPARADLPAKLRIDVTNSLTCASGRIVTAVKIAEDDRLGIYQDSAQNRGMQRVTVDMAQLLLDYYRDYGKEVIDTYFGGVPDIDGNGKVIVFVTPEANDNILGYVWPGDLLTKDACPASNEAELAYLGADEVVALTDPDRFAGFGLGALVHEVQHIAAVWERLRREEQEQQPLWLGEGYAEIASTRAARLAWEGAGGPSLTSRVTGDDWRAEGSGDVTSENVALFLQLFRLQASLADQPNSVLTNTGNGDDVYGTGWLFLRWLGDAYGGAAGGRHADATLFQTLTDRATPGGVDGLEAASGQAFETLFQRFLAAAMYSGTPAEAEVPRSFTSWDFVDALELWCFAVDPGAHAGSGCGSAGPGAPGAFPWPVTTDSQGYSGDGTVTLVDAQTVTLESGLFRGDAGQGGYRIHDFLTNGTGLGAEINVDVQPPAKVVVVRIF